MKRPCQFCGKEYEADSQWHTLNVHEWHCPKNPQVIRMIEFHKNRQKEEYDIVKWVKRE